jgi:glycosyltransferase involved in cell wall biosynthesis
MPTLSVVLPAYNEEGVIARTVEGVDDVVARLADDYEIIVVNDGSRDRTAERLAELQRRFPRLRVQTHPHNQGYGSALASGFSAATKDLVFLTDGDKQFDVAELAAFLPEMDEHTDLVIGWRRNRADPPLRLVNAWGWKLLVNGLFGYTARDVDCAFKLFRRSVWESIPVHSRGATFSAELLVKARRVGYRVKERPVSHLPRTAGSPTGAKPAVIVRAFIELFRLWRNLDRELRGIPAQKLAPPPSPPAPAPTELTPVPERLQGLLLIFLGCLDLALILLAQRSGWFEVRSPFPNPPAFAPYVGPLTFFLAIASLLAIALCVVGLKKLLAPDDWHPPKHLG